MINASPELELRVNDASSAAASSDQARAPGAVKISLHAQSSDAHERASISIQMEDPDAVLDKVLELLAKRFPVQAFYSVLANQQQLVRQVADSPSTQHTPSGRAFRSKVDSAMYEELVRLSEDAASPINSLSSNTMKAWLKDALATLSASELEEVTTSVSPTNTSRLAKTLLARTQDGDSALLLNERQPTDTIITPAHGPSIKVRRVSASSSSHKIAGDNDSAGKWETIDDSLLLADRETEHSNAASQSSNFSGPDSDHRESALALWPAEVVERVMSLGPEELTALICGTSPLTDLQEMTNDEKFTAWVDNLLSIRRRLNDKAVPIAAEAASSKPSAGKAATRAKIDLDVQTAVAGIRVTATQAPPPTEVPVGVPIRSLTAEPSGYELSPLTTDDSPTQHTSHYSLMMMVANHTPNLAAPSWLTMLERAQRSEQAAIERVCREVITRTLAEVRAPQHGFGAVNDTVSLQFVHAHSAACAQIIRSVRHCIFSAMRQICDSLGFRTSDWPTSEYVPLLSASDEARIFTGEHRLLGRFLANSSVRMAIHVCTPHVSAVTTVAPVTAELRQVIEIPTSGASSGELRQLVEDRRRLALTAALNEVIESYEWEPLTAKELMAYIESFFVPRVLTENIKELAPPVQLSRVPECVQRRDSTPRAARGKGPSPIDGSHTTPANFRLLPKDSPAAYSSNSSGVSNIVATSSALSKMTSSSQSMPPNPLREVDHASSGRSRQQQLPSGGCLGVAQTTHSYMRSGVRSPAVSAYLGPAAGLAAGPAASPAAGPAASPAAGPALTTKGFASSKEVIRPLPPYASSYYSTRAPAPPEPEHASSPLAALKQHHSASLVTLLHKQQSARAL